MPEGKGVPFVDLVTPHVELENELVDVFKQVLLSGMMIGGPMLEDFEQAFAQFCGVKHCVGVSSGTDALRFALTAAGVGAGDGVITAPNTFAATAEAIIQSGATPHFVDIDPATFNLSVDSLREYLEIQCDRSAAAAGVPVHRKSPQPIKAVIPVHLYGQMCDMDPIMELAETYGLVVIEDACQAHGAEYRSANGFWRKAGSIGNAAAFSFYPAKNLGAFGEAGAVTTNDDSIAKQVRMLRDHGQAQKYHHALVGYNGRLDALQAGLLRIKLGFLEEWNRQRRHAAETYNQLIQGADLIISPVEPAWSRAVYHLYVVRARSRDEVQKSLTKQNIGTGLHYPVPLHLQKAYAYMGYREGDFPIAERAAGEILSLPIYPQIRKEQQERVVEALLQASKTQIVGQLSRNSGQ